MKVLVFDSGVGGLSISERLPPCDLNYVLDHAFFPYGEKSAVEIQNRVLRVFEQVLGDDFKNSPALILLACNTASTLCLEQLRKIYPQHTFIGVVPAIKPAAQMSQSGVISVVATQRTVQSDYLDQLARDFAQGVKVQKVAAPRWVLLAEDWIYQRPCDVDQVLSETLMQLDPQSDLLVLGCTHFSHLKDDIQRLHPKVKVLDSVDAIVQRFKILYPKDYLPKHPKKALLIAPHELMRNYFQNIGYEVTLIEET